MSKAAPVFEARSGTSLDSLAPTWRALEETGAALACQRLDWMRLVLARLAEPAGASPFFVEVLDRRTGRTAMIVPLALVRRRGYREIVWFDLDVCDYAAPVLADGVDPSPDTARAMWDAVRRVLPRADLVRIRQIPDGIGNVPNPMAAVAGRRPTALLAFGGAIDGDPATLLDRMCRSSTRRDIGKQRRRLERAGAVRFVRAETPDQVEDLFSTLVRQRRQRFARIGRPDLLVRPEVEAFYRDAAIEGLSGGTARIFGLSVDGVWVATFYGIVHRDTVQGLLLTVDDGKAWRAMSPGVQIVAECLTWARSQGAAYFDLSVGDLPYKREFGLSERRLHALDQPLTVRGHAVSAAARLAERAKDRLKAHPAAFDRLRRLRRVLAKRAGP